VLFFLEALGMLAFHTLRADGLREMQAQIEQLARSPDCMAQGK
jgi:hypothetical protein